MEDLPRKAGFVPTGGKSMKPSIITDSSLKISRVEASPSQVASVDLERDGDNEEDMPWRPRTKSKTKAISKAGDEEYLSGNGVDDEVVIVLPQQKLTNRGWKVGAIAAAAVGALGSVALWMYSIRPRDPSFSVERITLDGFNLRFCTDSPLLLAVVDISLTLLVNSTNPNVSPIEFTDTIMNIYYRGTLLGQAKVSAFTLFSMFMCTLPRKWTG